MLAPITTISMNLQYQNNINVDQGPGCGWRMSRAGQDDRAEDAYEDQKMIKEGTFPERRPAYSALFWEYRYAVTRGGKFEAIHPSTRFASQRFPRRPRRRPGEQGRGKREDGSIAIISLCSMGFPYAAHGRG